MYVLKYLSFHMIYRFHDIAGAEFANDSYEGTRGSFIFVSLCFICTIRVLFVIAPAPSLCMLSICHLI